MQKSIQTLLESSKKILIVAPHNWHGDEITATLALQSALQSIQKEVIAVGPSEKPFTFSYLDTQSVRDELPESQNFVISLDTTKSKTKKIKYRTTDTNVEILIIPESGSFSESDLSVRKGISDLDLIITLGVDRLEALGALFESHAQLFTSTPILNISVSQNNDFFGTLNLVDTNKSSLCEVLFELFSTSEYFNTVLSKDIATLLLTGIIDNTGRFLDPKTKKSSFHAASKLYALGADQDNIIENLFKKKKLSTLKAWGEILKNIDVDSFHRISWTSLNQTELQSTHSTPNEVLSMNDELLRYIQNVDLSVFFIEYPDSTLIQIRSNTLQISMKELNIFLGGNGILQKNGLDFQVPHKKIIEIEYDFLKLLLDFQNNRLNLDPNIPLEKVNIFHTIEPKTNHQKIESHNSPSTPVAPEVIPFELFDLQNTETESPSEPNPKKETPTEESTPSKPNLANSNLPNWLQ